MPRIPARLVVLLLLPAAVACGAARRAVGSGDGAPAAAADTTSGGRWYGYEGGLGEAEGAARSITGATQYWTKVEGRWRAEGDSGAFTAHFLDRRLRRVSLAYGRGATTGTGVYTYDEQARLFHFGGEERRRTGTGRNVRTTTTTYSLALDQTGATSATRKAVGGRVQPLSADEVTAIVTRERAGRAAAVRALGAAR